MKKGEQWAGAENLVGKKRGILTILKRAANKKTKVAWLAQCDCGKTTTLTSQDFKRTDGRQIRSCGCKNHLTGEKSPHWRGKHGISASYWSRIKKGAKIRNLKFSISEIYVTNLLKKQNFACALSGLSIELYKTASLDRIVSSRGYVNGNVQWVHRDVNRIKSDLDQEYFISLCKKIANGRRKMHVS